MVSNLSVTFFMAFAAVAVGMAEPSGGINAGVKDAAEQWTTLRRSHLVAAGGATADEVANAVGKSVNVLWKRGRKLSHRSADGIGGYIRHGDQADNAAALEDLIGKFPANVTDDATESVGEAVSKTYGDEIRHAPGGPSPDPNKFDQFGKQRVSEAVAAGRATRAGNLDYVIGLYVGPGKAFKCYEEFEACLRMQARNLRPDQVAAINSMRQLIGLPSVGARLVKVLDVDTMRTKIQLGDATTGGYHVERQYVQDLIDGQPTTQQLSDRLRLDRTATPILPNSPRVILETRVTSAIAGNARYPRNPGYSNGNPAEFVEDLPHPNGGHGFALSKDGHSTPELTMGPSTMDAGEELTIPVTTARFEFNNGTPYPQTIEGVTAASWRLTPDPNDPQRFLWVPYVD
jgi:hypothetical protein